MQYFLGLSEFQESPLFDDSMMTHFRKRFTAEMIESINKRMFIVQKAEEDNNDDDDTSNPPANKGKLIFDATVAPTDIRYPIPKRYIAT